MGIDFGFGSSNTAITITRLARLKVRNVSLNVIEVILSEEIKALTLIKSLIVQFGY